MGKHLNWKLNNSNFYEVKIIDERLTFEDVKDEIRIPRIKIAIHNKIGSDLSYLSSVPISLKTAIKTYYAYYIEGMCEIGNNTVAIIVPKSACIDA